MSRFLVVTPELAGTAPVGLALISGAALMQRHAEASVPGFWSVRRFEPNNHRKTPTAHATVDDFGTLIEIPQ